MSMDMLIKLTRSITEVALEHEMNAQITKELLVKLQKCDVSKNGEEYEKLLEGLIQNDVDRESITTKISGLSDQINVFGSAYEKEQKSGNV